MNLEKTRDGVGVGCFGSKRKDNEREEVLLRARESVCKIMYVIVLCSVY